MSGALLDYASWLKWREGRTIHPDFEALTQAAYRSGYRRALEEAAAEDDPVARVARVWLLNRAHPTPDPRETKD